MKTFFDCIPCFIRQALDAIRLATGDEVTHERVLRQVLRTASEMDFRQSPPVMGQYVHRLVRDLTWVEDPYREAKKRSNRIALAMVPELKGLVDGSPDPFETAVRLAIAGNVIDFGVKADVTSSDVRDAVWHALETPIDGDVQLFRDVVSRAERILYLADNAGEIVFDRLLLEQLPTERTTLAVKGASVLNDATMEDAGVAGLIGLVDVIDNGSDAPGTILEDCSDGFRQAFDGAELVIAKGQGNYETLSEVAKQLFFVLKVKCPVIAEDLGCRVGSHVLRRSRFAALAAIGEADDRRCK
jgi:hypothetical protein